MNSIAIEPLPHDSNTSGIVLPEERSTKQRHYAFCANPACRENGQEFRFEIDQTLVPCPKCGATQAPMVGMLCKTHLLIRDKSGPFAGSSGLRYRMACDPQRKRHHLSTITNHEAFTDDRSICNCEDCLIEANKVNADAIGGIAIL